MPAMVFSSFEFLLLFLPVVLLGYFLGPKRARNGWLLSGSLMFYLWGSGGLIWLLLGSIVVNYLFGFIIESATQRNNQPFRLGAMFLALAFDLGLLAYYKYANFVVAQFGPSDTWRAVILPIGISFFTFQAMSYVIDLATGRAQLQRNLIQFGLYLSLFPQLIAGPIVRYHEVADQLTGRIHSIEKTGRGALRFAFGLIKKIIIADTISPVADAVFNLDESSLTSGAAWVGIAAYTLQIYFDFSGYSDMAIGMGLMFGFTFPENFARPYSSSSITEFWRRWHITLSNWFRDYLYIPLGGNRGSGGATIRNLIIVFFLTGLWHGANWTFIVWGLYHGTILIAERQTRWRDGNPSAFRRVFTMMLVMLGWVVFRAPTLDSALIMYKALLIPTSGEFPVDVLNVLDSRSSLVLVLAATIVLLPARSGLGSRLADLETRRGMVLRFGILAVGFPLAIVLSLAGTFSPFLYFQF